MATKIVIVGGGYGGVIAAVRLAGKTKQSYPSTEITLVNGLETFTERPLLHEHATRQAPTPRPMEHMLRDTGVRFVQGWATAIHPDTREVVVNGTQTIGYDQLIVALGSHIDRSAVPGAREFTDALDGAEGSARLRDHLHTLKSQARVLVVGGGATGIEAVAEIKALNPAWQVGIVTAGQFGAFKDARVQKYMAESMRRQGIDMYEHQRVTEVREQQLLLANGDTMPFDLCLWAGGFSVSPLAREAGVQVNERGQILVDPYLRSISHPEIYAIGDAAQPIYQPGAPMRMSLFPALVMGAHAADNLSALVHDQAQKPFSFAWIGQGIALGPHDAVGFMTYPNDQPVGPIYKGMLGVRVRGLFVAMLPQFLEMERRFPGFFFWFGKGRFKMESRQLIARPAAQSSV